jgi:hypothetical protein
LDCAFCGNVVERRKGSRGASAVAAYDGCKLKQNYVAFRDRVPAAKAHESDSMTELEEAALRLRRARAQRQWAARQNNYELEEALARESHRY